VTVTTDFSRAFDAWAAATVDFINARITLDLAKASDEVRRTEINRAIPGPITALVGAVLDTGDVSRAAAELRLLGRVLDNVAWVFDEEES
jgi:hypothetical protein